MRNFMAAVTASGFGCTLTSNGADIGHGWRSHHFVVGGTVSEKNAYDSFPTIGLNHSLDVGQVALLPQIPSNCTAAPWPADSASAPPAWPTVPDALPLRQPEPRVHGLTCAGLNPAQAAS